MSHFFNLLVVCSREEIGGVVRGPSHSAIDRSFKASPATRDGAGVTRINTVGLLWTPGLSVLPVLISLEEVDFVVSVDKGGVHVVQSRCQATLADGPSGLLSNKSVVITILPVPVERM